MDDYFTAMNEDLRRAYLVAESARKKGYDPQERVDIPLARNMAERVEGLISAIAPDIVGKGIPKRIEQLEKKYGALAWQVALIIAEEVACEKFCKFRDRKEAMEVGIRTGFAYHTVGVVAAPLEGLVELKIKKRADGGEYVAASYAGPIRGAGGTAAGVSVVITDYIRKKMGYGAYDPTEDEINRFITELYDYHERVTNLQYKPTEDEIRQLIRNIPVEVDGDPSENIEVSNYKDLKRVSTNKIRSGVCLVVSMLALKAPKLWKELRSWGSDFGIEWGFLSDFISLRKGKSQKRQGLSPDYTYISDLVAGRPVLTHPLSPGGFRLRYGKTRMSGYSSAGIHPATMVVLDRYIAIGTQLKVERPGKAAAITPADSIDGPIVRLANGSVVRLENEAAAKRYLPEVEEIIYLGDILISYGDFLDRAQPLVPAGYCDEWYIQELEKATVGIFGNLDLEKLSDYTEISREELGAIVSSPFLIKPAIKTSLRLSEKLGIPLHPYHTPYWNMISVQELIELVDWVSKGTIKHEKIVLPMSRQKRLLELIGVQHSVVSNEYVVVSGQDAEMLVSILGLDDFSISRFIGFSGNVQDSVSLINSVSHVKVRDKCGTFIGARMGRPEKAKMRALTGSPNALFPVGEEGGRLRSFQSSIEEGGVTSEFPLFFCDHCNVDLVYPRCPSCDSVSKQHYFCTTCGRVEKLCAHSPAKTMKRKINMSFYLDCALRMINTKSYPDLIKGVKGMSNKDRVVENFLKGVLRSMHDLCVNKDGTTRFDMTELPITHFRPCEISTPFERLLALGYLRDINGVPLESNSQLLEIKPQDVILPSGLGDESGDSVLFRVSRFIDDELVYLYGMERFYNLKSKSDLVGELVIGLAPHISAGTVGRIIGFSKSQTLLAHPLFHAAMRRDADGDEACVMLLMDALLNFSRNFLPDTRGAKTMDSPLVLTAKLVPAEVDDMVHRFDVAWRYPLEFYEATLLHKMPWDVDIELLGSRLGTDLQYEKIGFTHELLDINAGNTYSAYKSLPSMEEKLKGQMVLAERIRAVDARDVARLVIEKHLLRDIKGNLRKFSTQQFRCVKCNKKFRRPPLSGMCSCRGRLIFTVSEGSITKYLGPAISLAEKYSVSPYLRQSLELTKKRVEEVFGREKDKQEGLGRWFG
ncbi:DNA polymerase II large subunit [Candidatus Woesearchaeota archaeon]|nr:DNA polymerase II large subunit [Candidatus Woesearchaeota archaeon]